MKTSPGATILLAYAPKNRYVRTAIFIYLKKKFNRSKHPAPSSGQDAMQEKSQLVTGASGEIPVSGRSWPLEQLITKTKTEMSAAGAVRQKTAGRR